MILLFCDNHYFTQINFTHVVISKKKIMVILLLINDVIFILINIINVKCTKVMLGA